MATRDWSKASITDFAKVLEGTDNINTVTLAALQGTGGNDAKEDYVNNPQAWQQRGEEIRAYTQALINKAGLQNEVEVYGADRTQVGIYRNEDGTLRIEQLKGIQSIGDARVGKSVTYTIGQDFSVTKTEKPYISCPLGQEAQGGQCVPDARDRSRLNER
jgi:hypothetical protein